MWKQNNSDWLLIVWLHKTALLISSSHLLFFSDHLLSSFLHVASDIMFLVRKEWGLVTLTMFFPTRLCNHMLAPSTFNTMLQWGNISIRLMNNTSWLLSHLWAMIHYKHRVHGEGKQVVHRNEHKLSCFFVYHGLWCYRSYLI